MAKIKGRCTNIGKPCSKAINKEIMEVDETDFVCPECGKPLIKVQTGGSKPASTSNSNNVTDKNKKRLIAIIAGAVIVIGGVVAALCLGGSKDEQPVETVIPQETIEATDEIVDEVEAQPAVVEEPVAEEPAKEQAKEPVNQDPNPQPAQPKTVFNGAASLNGNAITFNRSYRLNLHTNDGDYIDIPAGAKIISCKFDGNNLVQGELIINGESRLLSGIKERLR